MILSGISKSHAFRYLFSTTADKQQRRILARPVLECTAQLAGPLKDSAM